MLVPADQALMHGTRWGELPYEISKRTDFRSAESELSNYGNGALGQLRRQRSEFSRGSGNSAPGSSALNVFIVRPANWQQSTRIQNAFIRVPSRAIRQYRSTHVSSLQTW
jgi:hypothetical protein